MKRTFCLLLALVLALSLAACGKTAQPGSDTSPSVRPNDTPSTSISQPPQSTAPATVEPSKTPEPSTTEPPKAEPYTVVETAEWCSNVAVSNIRKAMYNGDCYVVFDVQFTVGSSFPGNKYYNDIYHLWEDPASDWSRQNELITKADLYEAFNNTVGPGNYTRSYTMSGLPEGKTEATVWWQVGGIVPSDECELVRVTLNLTDDDNEAIVTMVAVVELQLTGLEK